MILDRLRFGLVQSRPVQAVRDLRLRWTSRSSYGQHGEDRFVFDRVFGGRTSGTYVDIGASHPIRISNTWLLYRNGWSGVTVEPIDRLRDLHRTLRPRDRQVSALIGDVDGEADFYSMYPSVLSTASAEQYRDLLAAGHRLVRQHRVPQMTVRRLLALDGLPRRVDFMSVDIEGLDEPIAAQIAALDPAQRPVCVCIEFMNEAAERAIRATLGPCYAQVEKLGANLIFW